MQFWNLVFFFSLVLPFCYSICDYDLISRLSTSKNSITPKLENQLYPQICSNFFKDNEIKYSCCDGPHLRDLMLNWAQNWLGVTNMEVNRFSKLEKLQIRWNQVKNAASQEFELMNVSGPAKEPRFISQENYSQLKAQIVTIDNFNLDLSTKKFGSIPKSDEYKKCRFKMLKLAGGFNCLSCSNKASDYFDRITGEIKVDQHLCSDLTKTCGSHFFISAIVNQILNIIDWVNKIELQRKKTEDGGGIPLAEEISDPMNSPFTLDDILYLGNCSHNNGCEGINLEGACGVVNIMEPVNELFYVTSDFQSILEENIEITGPNSFRILTGEKHYRRILSRPLGPTFGALKLEKMGINSLEANFDDLGLVAGGKILKFVLLSGIGLIHLIL